MCMFLHAEGARAEAGSHRAPPAGSNAEPGRTTAASVSSIPCRRSPASPASSLCGVGLRQKSVLEWCGSVGRQGSPDRWMILGSAFSLDSSLCALVLHSRLVFESPPLLLQSLSRTPGGLRLHCHKRWETKQGWGGGGGWGRSRRGSALWGTLWLKGRQTHGGVQRARQPSHHLSAELMMHPLLLLFFLTPTPLLFPSSSLDAPHHSFRQYTPFLPTYLWTSMSFFLIQNFLHFLFQISINYVRNFLHIL